MPARALRALAHLQQASAEHEAPSKRPEVAPGKPAQPEPSNRAQRGPSANEVSLEACASHHVKYDEWVFTIHRCTVKRLILTVATVLSVLSGSALAQQPVYVAAYDFPPFFSDTLETDVTSELVELLNQSQSSYEFMIQAIPPNGRYQALSPQGCCDLILFESAIWGWRDTQLAFEATLPLLKGRERLVAKKVPGRTQAFFDDLTGKTLGGVKGYHYLMAGEVLKSAEVAERYGIYLADSRITNVRMLIGGRIDAAVLNDELLSALRNASVNYLDQLLVSERVQHEYAMGAIIAEGKGISRDEMQRLFRDLARDGQLDNLFARFNLQRFQVYRR